MSNIVEEIFNSPDILFPEEKPEVRLFEEQIIFEFLKEVNDDLKFQNRMRRCVDIIFRYYASSYKLEFNHAGSKHLVCVKFNYRYKSQSMYGFINMLSYIANIFPDNWINGEIGMFCRKFMADVPTYSAVYLYKHIPGSGSFMSVNATNIKLMPGFRLLNETDDEIPENDVVSFERTMFEIRDIFFKKDDFNFTVNLSKWLKNNIHKTKETVRVI